VENSIEKIKLGILHLINGGNYEEALKCLNSYIEKIGIDEDVQNYQNILYTLLGKKVLVLCIDCTRETIEKFLNSQIYKNLEVVSIQSKQDLVSQVLDSCLQSGCPYVCFWEEGRKASPIKILRMLQFMEENGDAHTSLCLQNYEELEEGIVSGEEFVKKELYQNCGEENKILLGTSILLQSLENEVNLFGNLSCVMIRTSSFLEKSILHKIIEPQSKEEAKIILMFSCIFERNVQTIQEELVTFEERKLDLPILREKFEAYESIKRKMGHILGLEDREENKWKELPTVYRRLSYENDSREVYKNQEIAKKMTFFYTDKGEYFNLEPIAKEAEKRGYEVKFTKDIKEEAEIGIYCQHICFPENAKFSVILLHDMMQRHDIWPNIWTRERWNQFDIGILPGEDWTRRWSRSAGWNFANPRLGVYELGYPKGDDIDNSAFLEEVEERKKRLELKFPYTVLYAPSWENDEKEDDFVRALQSLEVNLLIKQASWSKSFQGVIRNIEEMRKIHEGKYDNVYYLEPEESILVALHICDLIVSDESSVMVEGLLYKKSSIAVQDWLIPDTVPPRFAVVPNDYVHKCKKVELREQVELFIKGMKEGKARDRQHKQFFSNMGMCCSDIVDLIEFYTGEKENCSCLSKEVLPIYMPHGLWD